MMLNNEDKLKLMQKAADIVISNVQGKGFSFQPDDPAKLIESTYNKMVELLQKS